ncbi:MAG: hypothetical protein LW808_001900 [Verrucomicrobiota bacterium]|nr:MAG: hypothetical protein LW808_001900 [Verrucomicrobiota bacterium]
MSITNASSRYDPRQVIRQYGNLKKDVANKEEAFGTMNVTENLAICMAKDRGKKGKISDDSGKYIILKGQQPVKNRSSVDGSSVLESFQYKISFKNRRELAKLLQDPKLLETTLHLMERADKLKDSGAVTELQKIADNRKAPPALRRAIRQKLDTISKSSERAPAPVDLQTSSPSQDSANVGKKTRSIAIEPQSAPIFNGTISEKSRQQLQSANLLQIVQQLQDAMNFSKLTVQSIAEIKIQFEEREKNKEDELPLEDAMVKLGYIAQDPKTPAALKEAILESGCAQLDPNFRTLADSVRFTSSIEPKRLKPEDVKKLQELGNTLAYPERTSPIVQKEIAKFFTKISEWIPELAKSIDPSHLKPGDEKAIQVLYDLTHNPSIPPAVKKAIPQRSYIQLGAQPDLLRKTLELKASIDSSYLRAGDAAGVQKAAKELSAILNDKTASLELRSIILKTGCAQLESCSEQLNRSLELLASVTPSNLQATAQQLNTIANDLATPRILKETILRTGYSQLELHPKLLQDVFRLTASLDPSNLKAGDEKTLKQLTDIATNSETPIILQKAIFKFLEPAHKQLSNEVPQLMASIDSTGLKKGDEKTMVKLNFVANNPATPPNLKEAILKKVYEICKEEGAHAAKYVWGVPEDILRKVPVEGCPVVATARDSEDLQRQLREGFDTDKFSDIDGVKFAFVESPYTSMPKNANLRWNTFLYFNSSREGANQSCQDIFSQLHSLRKDLGKCSTSEELEAIKEKASHLTKMLEDRTPYIQHAAFTSKVLNEFDLPISDAARIEYEAKTTGFVKLSGIAATTLKDIKDNFTSLNTALTAAEKRLDVGTGLTDAQKQKMSGGGIL